MSLSYIFFGILAILAITSAVFTILSKNPVASAIGLVFHFFMLAGLYLTLQAQFVAVIQILVYAGAIMVLVVFVIMLLNLGDEELLKEKFNFKKILAILFATALVVEFAAVYLSRSTINTGMAKNASHIGTVQYIGKALFTDYLLPVEAVGILLLAAILGAVVLAKRKLD